MITSTRLELVTLISELSEHALDLRLGQLFANLLIATFNLMRKYLVSALVDVEDKLQQLALNHTIKGISRLGVAQDDEPKLVLGPEDHRSTEAKGTAVVANAA